VCISILVELDGVPPLDRGWFFEFIPVPHSYLQVRINGGTNIAAAFSYAGKMFKKQACEPNAAKLVILMTDGRVDTYQVRKISSICQVFNDPDVMFLISLSNNGILRQGAFVLLPLPAAPLSLSIPQSKEAQQVTTQLADEHPNTTLFAFGVGRGIDRAECIAMIEAGRPANGCKFPRGSERYIDLFFKDEGPW